MITSVLKDQLLKFLVENAKLEQHVFADRKQFVTELGAEFENLEAMLYQFERLGLLKNVGVGSQSVEFRATAELHDFFLRGGFTVKEELFEKNIEKLLYEIDVLKNSLAPTQMETANKIGSLVQGIAAGLQILTIGNK